MIPAFLSLFAMLSPDTGAQQRAAPMGAFQLETTVDYALEGGPLILRVSLLYTGKTPTLVFPLGSGGQFPVTVRAPDNWSQHERCMVTVFGGGGPGGGYTLRPGERLSQIHYLHHQYGYIPSGLVRFEVEWPIRGAGRCVRKGHHARQVEGPLIACPRQQITVNIAKATSERLKELTQRICHQGNQDRQPGQSSPDYAKYVLFTPHAALIPAAIHLLQSGADASAEELIEFIYSRPKTPAVAQALLLDYLGEDAPVAADRVFMFWKWNLYTAAQLVPPCGLPSIQAVTTLPIRFFINPKPILESLKDLLERGRARRRLLPETTFRRLTRAPNVWVRALTYITFPNRCEQPWVAGLLRELKELTTPPTPQEFKALLRDLDSRHFKIRERATRALLRKGDTIEPALRAALAQRLSLEVRRRLRLVLAQAGKTCLEDSRALAFMVSSSTPQARAVLEALARGHSEARLTREAMSAVSKLRQPPPLWQSPALP